MSFDRMSGAARMVAVIILAFTLSGCGAGGPVQILNTVEQRSHNKLATKVLADIAIARVMGARPTKVARRRGRETL